MKNMINFKFPEKEHLIFNYITTDDTDIQNLYKFAEKELYFWKDIEICLPETSLKEINNWLFETFSPEEECAEIAGVIKVDPSSSSCTRRKLNDRQLRCVRQTGKLYVPSIVYTGQSYEWRVCEYLIEGIYNIKEHFWKNLASAARLIVVTLVNRVISTNSKFSIVSALNNICSGIYQIVDLLIGLPHNNCGDVENKLFEEMLQFLSCELRVALSEQGELLKFWDYFEYLSCLPKTCTIAETKSKLPSNWPTGYYTFFTPDNNIIDMRLAHSGLEKVCRDVVCQAIESVESSKSGWLEALVQNCARDMVGNGMALSLEELRKRVVKLAEEEKCKLVLKLIYEGCRALNISDSICDMLKANLHFHMLCEETVEEYTRNLDNYESDMLERLKEAYPCLSMIEVWTKRKMQEAKERFYEENRLTPYQLLVERCRAQHLFLHEYFSHRMLSFIRDRKPVLTSQLQKNISFPDKTFHSEINFILPTFWKIVPEKSAVNKTVYRLETSKTIECSTQYPFWRWLLYLQRTCYYMLTIGQLCLIDIPFRSRVSYSAVFCDALHNVKYVLDKNTGQLSQTTGESVTTMAGHLRRLWRHVRYQRHQFETRQQRQMQANGSYIPNCYQRILQLLHQLWTVGVKGVLGSMLLCVIFTLSCLLISTLSLVAGLLMPLWIPIFTLFLAVYKIMVLDNDSNNRVAISNCLRLPRAFIWHLSLCGFLNLLMQILCITFIPILTIIWLLLVCLRLGLRLAFDSVVYYSYFRLFAKLPYKNSMIYRLLDGPGLHRPNQTVLLSTEHIVIAIAYYLELMVLDLWREQMEKLIRQPVHNYEQFVKDNLGNLAVKVDWLDKQINFISVQEETRLRLLKRLYDKQQESLGIRVVISKCLGNCLVKMNPVFTKTIMQLCERTCIAFYAQCIAPLLEVSKCGGVGDVQTCEQWWRSKGLEINQFAELSTQALVHLFGDTFLEPVLPTQKTYQLEVNDATLDIYSTIMASPRFTERRHSETTLSNVCSDELNINFDPMLNQWLDQPNKVDATGSQMNLEYVPVTTYDDPPCDTLLPEEINVNGTCQGDMKLQQRSSLDLYLQQLQRQQQSLLQLPPLQEDYFFFNLMKKLPRPMSSFTYQSTLYFPSCIQSMGGTKPTIASVVRPNLTLNHPLIISLLLHQRDRENSLLNLQHPLVIECVSNCMNEPTTADFSADLDPPQMVESSNYSLDDFDENEVYTDLDAEHSIQEMEKQQSKFDTLTSESVEKQLNDLQQQYNNVEEQSDMTVSEFREDKEPEKHQHYQQVDSEIFTEESIENKQYDSWRKEQTIECQSDVIEDQQQTPYRWQCYNVPLSHSSPLINRNQYGKEQHQRKAITR